MCPLIELEISAGSPILIADTMKSFHLRNNRRNLGLDPKNITNFQTGLEELTTKFEKNPDKDKKKAKVTLLGQILPALKEKF